MSHPIPHDALDDRLFFGGTAGSGKTYGAGTAVERLLNSAARVCIPDPLGVWYGLALAVDGKHPSAFRQKEKLVVFGGAHGDLPLTEHSGALIGETVATMAESCILDLSELKTGAGERRFMLAFLTALYAHKPREPLHVIFDEADLWAPQRVLDKEGEAMKLLGMMENICRRGRVKGFIPWLISQRPAVISKNVLSQIDGMIAFKLTSVQDRDAIGDWVQGQADKAEWEKIWSNMPTLERGRGLVWLPARGILKTSMFPEKVTFDSSRTPKRGERVKSAKPLKPINLDKLKERLASVEAETKANDPNRMRAEIARLQSEIARKPAQPTPAAADTKAIYQSGYAAGADHGFNRGKAWGSSAGHAGGAREAAAFLGELEGSLGRVLKEIGNRRNHLKDAEAQHRASLDKIEAEHAAARQKPAGGAPAMQRRPMAPPAPRQPGMNDGASPAQDDGVLAKGERVCLIAIAQHPNGVTRTQLSILTSYKKSTRDEYLKKMRARGLIEGGARIIASNAGLATLGSNYQPLPIGDALRAKVLADLPEGESRILEIVCRAGGSDVGREMISIETNYAKSTRDEYIKKLVARELVVKGSAGAIKASPELFG